MATLEITLPEPLRDFMDEQVESGAYGSPSAFVESLLRAAQNQATQAKLEGLLLKGLHSGQPQEITPDYWDNKKAALRARFEQAA